MPSVTIRDIPLTLTHTYAPGQVMSREEAHALNALRSSQLCNKLGHRIDREPAMRQWTRHDLQRELDDLAAEHKFAVPPAGGKGSGAMETISRRLAEDDYWDACERDGRQGTKLEAETWAALHWHDDSVMERAQERLRVRRAIFAEGAAL